MNQPPEGGCATSCKGTGRLGSTLPRAGTEARWMKPECNARELPRTRTQDAIQTRGVLRGARSCPPAAHRPRGSGSARGSPWVTLHSHPGGRLPYPRGDQMSRPPRGSSLPRGGGQGPHPQTDFQRRARTAPTRKRAAVRKAAARVTLGCAHGLERPGLHHVTRRGLSFRPRRKRPRRASTRGRRPARTSLPSRLGDPSPRRPFYPPSLP